MEYPARKISDLIHIGFFLIIAFFLVSTFFTMMAVQKKINRNAETITSIQESSDYAPYNDLWVKGEEVIATINAVRSGEPNKIKIILQHGSDETVFGFESETSENYLSYHIIDSSNPFYINPQSNYSRRLVFDGTGTGCIVFARQEQNCRKGGSNGNTKTVRRCSVKTMYST